MSGSLKVDPILIESIFLRTIQCIGVILNFVNGIRYLITGSFKHLFIGIF